MGLRDAFYPFPDDRCVALEASARLRGLMRYIYQGIVLMLMALRVHAVQEEAKYNPASASLMPSWFSGDDEKMMSTTGPTTEDGEVPLAEHVSRD